MMAVIRTWTFQKVPDKYCDCNEVTNDMFTKTIVNIN